MKIESTKLQAAISFLGLAISKDSTARPSTKMIELSTENGRLFGYTFDGSNKIRYNMCECNENFTIVLMYSALNDIVKHCDGIVDLKVNDKYLSIKTTAMKCKLPIHMTTIAHPTVEGTTFVDFSKIKDIMSLCKTVIDPKFTVNCYKHICFRDKIMVSNLDNVAIFNYKPFNEDLLLQVDSVEILCKLETFKYTISSTSKGITGTPIRTLDVSNDLITASLAISNDEQFQYDDLMELFADNMDKSVKIEKAKLSKAISASQLFKHALQLKFTADGIFIYIPQNDFTYQISSDKCADFSYTITTDILKLFTSINSDFTLYYGNSQMIKCKADDVEEIISISEVVDNE